MRIATWNVNSVNARLETVVRWFEAAQPDVACLQEIKCVDEKFPAEAFERLGYNVAVHGQKSYNGVAILSKAPLEDVTRGLPEAEGDEHARYIEAVVSGPQPVRVASIYLPNGNPIGTEKYAYKLAWMGRLHRHAQSLLALEEPFVLTGDYNDPRAARRGIPEELGQRRPLPAGEPRRFPGPEEPRPHRGLPGGGRRAGRLHLLGLPGRRLAAEQRHPHRPRAALPPGRGPAPRRRDPPRRAQLGQALRPRAAGGGARGLKESAHPGECRDPDHRRWRSTG
jgi:hypothetical protein